MASDSSPLLDALAAHTVSATVVDLDHYHIHGGIAIETDYIISVEPTEKGSDDTETFETFRISKTYSTFRSLSSQLKKSAEKACSKVNGDIPPNLAQAIKFTESLNHLVDSQKTEYLGKVSYDYVKLMAKQRSEILNDALDMVTHNYPADLNTDDSLKGMSDAIENFFLTDVLEEEDSNVPSTPPRKTTSSSMTPMKRLTSTKKHRKDKSGNIMDGLGNLFGDKKDKKQKEAPSQVTFASPVVPKSKKTRRSIAVRTADEEELKASGATDDDAGKGATQAKLPPSSAPVTAPQKSSSSVGAFLTDNPYAVVVLVAIVLGVLRRAQFTKVTMDSDIAILVSFACFCFGLNWPRPSPVVVQKKPALTKKLSSLRRTSVAPGTTTAAAPAARLLRTSMAIAASPTLMDSVRAVQKWDALGEVEEEEEEPIIGSPMQTYPEGAPLGEYLNCVSEPSCESFHIRGPNYLSDKVKVPSGPFLFPTRGVDLFLTDDAPENVGRNTGCMGGRLRDVPTFVINFRLPWGVLVFYSEIPERFLPFIRSCYDPFFEDTLPSLDDMPAGDRTLARFLMGDEDHKNRTLKIVPVIVKGPWIVQSVAGGKPAIVGTKMPLNYMYSPRVGDKAEYLEADLDVVGSAIARKICSVVTSYTQGVTIDLGFVIEGQAADELPEQMLLAARLHGIDPISAPALPPMKDQFMIDMPPSIEEEQ